MFVFFLQSDSVDVPEGKKYVDFLYFSISWKDDQNERGVAVFLAFLFRFFNIRFKILYREKYQSVLFFFNVMMSNLFFTE